MAAYFKNGVSLHQLLETAPFDALHRLLAGGVGARYADFAFQHGEIKGARD